MSVGTCWEAAWT